MIKARFCRSRRFRRAWISNNALAFIDPFYLKFA
jgi:hypothetical protein